MSEPLNILQIAPRVPWPPTDGGAIGIYNITRFVAARGHRITFVAFEHPVVGANLLPNTADRPNRRDLSNPFVVSPTSSVRPDDPFVVPPTSSVRPPDPFVVPPTTSVRPDDNDMSAFCRLEIVDHDTRNRVFGAVKNLFSREPYSISKYRCAEMFARIDALCAEQTFDVVHVDHVHMAMYGEYIQQRYGIPYVLREHNFEATIHRRFAEHSRLPLIAPYLRMQAARLYRYEIAALEFPDVIAAITETDARDIAVVGANLLPNTAVRPSRNNFSDPFVLPPTSSVRPDDPFVLPPTSSVRPDDPFVVPPTSSVRPDDPFVLPPTSSVRPSEFHAPSHRTIQIIPAGVDVERLRPFADQPTDAHVVIVGPLHWSPNLDAALWFCNDIWPRIRTAVPGARCTIAGAQPPARLQRMAGDGISVPGFVDDFSELLASARVLAVPLRVGGGMRIKLLEFFAHGKAVVSTSIGAEGNLARDGIELLLADDAYTFADAVVRVLKNPDLAMTLGASARLLAEQQYAWPHIASLFESAYWLAMKKKPLRH